MGAVGLWTRGRDEQRRAGCRAVAGRRPAHRRVRLGASVPPASAARPRLRDVRTPRITLTGRCALVADADRADALLMPARVDPATRGRAREWLLVELAGAPPGTVEHLPRVRTVWTDRRSLRRRRVPRPAAGSRQRPRRRARGGRLLGRGPPLPARARRFCARRCRRSPSPASIRRFGSRSTTCARAACTARRPRTCRRSGLCSRGRSLTSSPATAWR